MKYIRSLATLIALATLALTFQGCQQASSNTTVSALQNPNNEAKAVQAGTAGAVTAFLANANNTQYQAEVVAVGNTLAVLAAGNPQNITEADIAGLVATMKLAPATANQITAIATALLGTFNSSFAINFPTLKPNYNIFLLAVSNGIKQATGGTAVPLPVIPWPPVVAPIVVAPKA